MTGSFWFRTQRRRYWQTWDGLRRFTTSGFKPENPFQHGVLLERIRRVDTSEKLRSRPRFLSTKIGGSVHWHKGSAQLARELRNRKADHAQSLRSNQLCPWARVTYGVYGVKHLGYFGTDPEASEHGRRICKCATLAIPF